jgi:hypothetical protein
LKTGEETEKTLDFRNKTVNRKRNKKEKSCLPDGPQPINSRRVKGVCSTHIAPSQQILYIARQRSLLTPASMEVRLGRGPCTSVLAFSGFNTFLEYSVSFFVRFSLVRPVCHFSAFLRFPFFYFFIF